MVAMYRIARQGWTALAAYEEARAVGMRWWHYPMKARLETFASRHDTLVKRPVPAVATSR